MNFMFLVYFACSINIRNINAAVKTQNIESIKKSLEEHQGHLLVNRNKTKSVPLKIANITKVPYKPVIVKKKENMTKIITPHMVQEWAKEISDVLHETEELVVHKDTLLKGFANMKIELRNGSEIVEKAAKALEELLERRGKAAEAIMRKAEELSTTKTYYPRNYTFDYSVDLNVLKKFEPPEDFELPLSCRSLNKMKLQRSEHFDAEVSLDHTSVHVAMEVFDCNYQVVQPLFWSEALLNTFQENYAQDATLDFQYFCSAKGFLRHYPAALWQSLYKLKTDGEELYDCRLRPWYVSASGAPRDVLILLDASGSMYNSSNKVKAEHFTLALLSALTDDDQVNVLRFNVLVESPISCFNEKLVPANHVNSAAMMGALKLQKMKNYTRMADVLEYSITMLKKSREDTIRPPGCQQAIVLLTDSLYANFTDLLKHLDPEGEIRLFVMWLHDQFGLRDGTRLYGETLSCERDGYFAELISDYDVTEQVMRILRVLERPLVAQRKRRLRVYSDVYANVEDPRRSENYWVQKENEEQVYRYTELRKNKNKFLKTERLYGDSMHLLSLENYGQYYEGDDINYRLQISVSVPVFESTTLENITMTLDEEKQRNSTRTYPVNRLLGVAGVDIPIDHLKLILPYHLVGAGGSLFLLDHRGNIVVHDNTKPVFDGDILKPGYRTVDFLDVEQPGVEHLPRHYPDEWLEFRNTMVIDKPVGNKTLFAKHIIDNGMRLILGSRDYYWKRVMDHYTIVVALPKHSAHHAVSEPVFTKELAEEAYKALSGTEFSVHPDWLYCQHVDPHFDSSEAEVLHFIKRRRDERNFATKKLKHLFTPITPTLLEKTYHCNEELMAKLSREAIATLPWTENEQDPGVSHECTSCQLGSTTAFFASESGLTRWQIYRATSGHAEPVPGSEWARGVGESFYARATAATPRLLIHAPAPPKTLLRNTANKPPPLEEKWRWLTAARTLVLPNRGVVGVAGYHFHHKHLEDLLDAKTNFPCTEEDEDKCEPQCDGKDWSCLLIDDEGWIVARTKDEKEEEDEENLVREHLATFHPTAMALLLNASVFKLRWVHDYQGVCFPPKEEKLKAAAPSLPSIMRSMWTSIKVIMHVSQDLLTIMTVLASSSFVKSDTAAEKEKRRKRLRRDYEREKYERLYDMRVLVNRTKFAACDRSRAVYELQRTQKAIEVLKRPFNFCKWPLAGAEVLDTNLLLLAVYNHCPYKGRPLNDPIVNEPVWIPEEFGSVDEVPAATRLACWRHRVPLPARAPATACYPHRYPQEQGYRQCGPWLPDPEENISNAIKPSFLIFILILIYYLISDDTEYLQIISLHNMK